MLREFTVIPVLNGYIVRIGCQTVVFASPEALIETIMKYLKDPVAVENQWTENALNAKHFNQTLAAPIAREGYQDQCATQEPNRPY